VACHRAIGDRYLQAIDLTDGDHSRLPGIEQRCFGCGHAEVGAKIAELWRLPQHFVDAILAHHDSSKSQPDSLAFAQVLELAGMVAASFTLEQSDGVLARFTQACRHWLDMSAEQVKVTLNNTASATKEFSKLVNLDIGGPPQIDAVLSQAEQHMIQHLASMSGRAPADNGKGLPLNSGRSGADQSEQSQQIAEKPD
jgi:hypothetical protein